MLQTLILVPLPAFNVYSTQVNLDNLTFSQFTVSLFSSLSVYNNFIEGTYGILMGNTLVANFLIQQYSLSGSISNNCVSPNMLKFGTIGSIGLACEADYMPYLLPNLNCKNKLLYFDLTIAGTSLPCGSCSNTCVTTCFGAANTQCSCYFNSLDSWITTQNPVTSYYCSGKIFLILGLTSLNLSFYSPITISPIQVAKNSEYTVEFWAYIYSYTGGQFLSLDIIWDKHVRLSLVNIAGQISTRCFPFVDQTNAIVYTDYTQDFIFEKNWFYIKCAVNRNKGVYMTQSNVEKNIVTTLPLWPSPFTTTSLYIGDNVSAVNFNYGFSFIRELKLLSSYNFFQYNLARK